MNNYEIRTITPHDVSGMAELLMKRQELEAKEFPFLKNSCLQVEYVTDKLQQLLVKSKAIGMGAFSGGELVGYLLLWLEHGCFSHSAFVPIGSPMYYDAFSRLSFGIEQVYAVLNVREYKPFDILADVDVRLATENDREAMGEMSSIISKYQNAAPVFIPAFPEVLASIKEGFKGSLEDEDVMVLIAEKDKQQLGFQMYEQATPNLMTPDDGIELCVAGTHHFQMGRGVGKRLTNEGIRIMKEKGYGSITTDWRITNLASSTFWPKCGFKPIAYRMARVIDTNYAWANLNNRSIQQS